MKLFGGSWTEEKLDILEKYLKQYLLVFKKKRDHFTLVYIDAFAGEGTIQIEDDEGKEFIAGSALRALRVTPKVGGKPFDQFIFNEVNPEKVTKLKMLKKHFSNRNILISQKDANDALKDLCADIAEWKKKRAVLFLDPFSIELEWTTLEAIAQTKAIDVWLLFPVNSISRILPRDKKPPISWEKKLTRIFGDNSWEKLYKQMPSLLPGHQLTEREKGEDKITQLYKERLKSVFGDHLLEESKTLIFPEKNKILFEFMFLAGNPNGRPIAHKIAKYLIEKI